MTYGVSEFARCLIRQYLNIEALKLIIKDLDYTMLTPLKLLIIDCTEAFILQVLRTLQQFGYSPSYERAYSRSGLVSAVESEPWDIIIAFHLSSGPSIAETIHLIRRQGSNAPIVVVLPAQDDNAKAEALEAGAFECITDSEAPDLGSAVDKALRTGIPREPVGSQSIQLQHKTDPYHQLVELLPTGVIIHTDFIVRYVNRAALDIARTKNAKDVVGRPIWDFIAPDYRDMYRQRYQNLLEGDYRMSRMEGCLLAADGTSVNIEGTATTILYEGEPSIISAFQDITARKTAEAHLEKTNRILRVLSEINEALIHASVEAELLQSVCKIIVEVGGYRMAWIGYPEDDAEKTVRPMAFAGHEDGYLSTVKVSWADSELGRGPTGTAIRTGQPSFACSVADDPAYSPWREEAMKRGYASSTALPLSTEDRILGSLSLYASAFDAFDEEEIRLLLELAGDLSYGITSIRAREERIGVEEALRASEAKFRLLAENSTDMISRHSPDGTFVYVSPASRRLLGYEPGELIGTSPYDLFHPDDRAAILKAHKEIIERPTTETIAYRVRKKDGSYAWFETTSRSVIDELTGQVVELQSASRDISRRKSAEDALLESERKYRLLFENMTAAFALHEMIYDENGRPVNYRYIEVNPAFERHTGVPAAALVGKTIKDVMPETEQYWIDVFGKVAMTGEPTAYQNYARELGKYYDVWVFSPDKDRFAVVFTDITDQVRSEEHKREFYRRTIMAATQGKLIITSSAEINHIAGTPLKSWPLVTGEELQPIRQEVRTICKTLGMEDSLIDDMLLCIGEAGTNAIKHAGGGVVSINMVDGGMLAMISDKGPGIDALVLPDATLRLGYSTTVSLGMGYKAIISLADRVYLSTDSEGTTIAFVLPMEKTQTQVDINSLPDTW